METYLNFPVGFTFCSVYRVMKADCCFFERSHHTESSSLTLLKLSAGAVATSRKEHRSRKADQAPAAPIYSRTLEKVNLGSAFVSFMILFNSFLVSTSRYFLWQGGCGVKCSGLLSRPKRTCNEGRLKVRL